MKLGVSIYLTISGCICVSIIIYIESVHYTMRTDIEIQNEKPKYR